MANICENTLHVYSEDSSNIEYVKKFFENSDFDYNFDNVESDYLDIFFDSKWIFPENEMDELVHNLPTQDISMTCLSIEWGNHYCMFHTYCDGIWCED